MFEAGSDPRRRGPRPRRTRGSGLMVGANTFRNPALVAKMATTLDHISGGRAILGIGGAWFETEHTAFGIEFGGSPGERLRWLDEAARIMRGMLHGERAVRRGATTPLGRCATTRRRCRRTCRSSSAAEGSGERCAPSRATPTPGTSAAASRTCGTRTRCCAATATRSAATSRRSSGPPASGSASSATIPPRRGAWWRPRSGRNGGARPWPNQLAGTPEQVAEQLRPYLGIGFRHLIVGFPAPHDAESLERLATEVRPMLGRAREGRAPRRRHGRREARPRLRPGPRRRRAFGRRQRRRRHRAPRPPRQPGHRQRPLHPRRAAEPRDRLGHGG